MSYDCFGAFNLSNFKNLGGCCVKREKEKKDLHWNLENLSLHGWVRDLMLRRNVREEKLMENDRQKRYKIRKGGKWSRATAMEDLPLEVCRSFS